MVTLESETLRIQRINAGLGYGNYSADLVLIKISPARVQWEL